MTLHKPSPRKWIIYFVVAALYFGSHFVISRLSEQQVAKWGFPGRPFFYLTTNPDLIVEQQGRYLLIHYFLVCFFAPAWGLDCLFDGPQPILSLPMSGGFERPDHSPTNTTSGK